MAKGGKSKGKPKSESKKGKDKQDNKATKKKTEESEFDQELASLWEENLRAAAINDEKWKCNVTILLQSKSEYTKLIEWYEDGSKSGSRRVIKNIANSEVILELKLSQGKKGMTKFHPLQGVCTAAAKSLSGGKLPMDILAKLIKYKIIRFKEADLASKRAQILEERELQRTVQKMMVENEKNENSDVLLGSKKKGGKDKGKEKDGKNKKKGGSDKESKKDKKKGKSDGKGGKDKGKKKGLGKGKSISDAELNECWDGSNLVPLETPEKWNTNLRKRGEGWKDTHQIDDAPKDGADLYVTLTGFYDPNLLIELIKIGVPVTAVVKLELDEEELPRLNSILSFEGSLDEENILTMQEPVKRNASMLESPCGKDKKQTPGQQRKKELSITPEEAEARDAEIMKYWADMEAFNNDRNNLTLLKDVALVNFPVPLPLNIPATPEELVETHKSMVNVISQFLYDIEHISRQHTNYVRNVKLLSLEPRRTRRPTLNGLEEKEIPHKPLNNLDGMDIYKTMVQLIPMECQSVSFIFHCMLEQVVAMCKEPEVLEILPPQENFTSTSVEGLSSQKRNSKDETNEKRKTKSEAGSSRASSTTKEGSQRGGSKEPQASRKTSKDSAVSKGDISPPRSKRSKDRSKDLIAVTKSETSLPAVVNTPVIETITIDMVQSSLDSRVKHLNKAYNLFHVPSPRAIKREPLVILHGDAETLRSYHVAVPEIDPATIFEEAVKHGRMEILWNKYKEQTLEEKLRYDFHVHQLWNCMHDRNLTLRMLKNHLHLLIFEKIEGSKETFEIDCNKAGVPSKKNESGSTVGTTGFMKFTHSLFKSRRNKVGAGKTPQQQIVQTPGADQSECKTNPDRERAASIISRREKAASIISRRERADSTVTGSGRSSRMDCIGEMFENPEIICLTDPLKHVLTGFRSMQQRESVVDLHKYTVVEEFNSNIMLQNLFNAHAHFSSCTVHYYAPTDVILMNFHNSTKKTDMVETSWMGKLTTPVSFRDFCEFVYEEELEWINKQEEEYQRQLKESKEKRKDAVPGVPGQSVFPGGDAQGLLNTTYCADAEFVKAGSIKHNDILKKLLAQQEQEVEVEIKPIKKGKEKSKGDKGDKGKKGPKEKKEKKVKEKKEKSKSAKSDKSAKSEKGKKDKSLGKSENKKLPLVDDVDTEVEIPFVRRASLRCAKEGEPHAFEGFDLNPVRFQFDGKSTHFFAPDGTEVESEFRELLFSNCKLFKTSVQKRGHTLFVYNTVECDQPKIEKPFTFHIISANRCILAFGERQEKQLSRKLTSNVTPQVIVTDDPVVNKPSSPSGKKEGKEKGNAANQNESTNSGKTDKAESRSKSKQPNKSTNRSAIPESEPRRTSNTTVTVTDTPQVVEETPVIVEPINWKYDLRASWPTGLVVETVVGSTPLDPFHIKQTYLQKGPECEKIRDEDHRIFLRNGTVLIFLNNGFVEVLCPDSTITLCKSFKKPPVYSRQPSISSRNPKTAECPEEVRIGGKDLQPKEARAKVKSLSEDLNKTQPLPPPPPPQLQVDQYHVITVTGKQYSVHEEIDPYPNLTEATTDGPYKPLNLVVDDNYEKFLLRRATDYELGEVFIRRGDGTNSLLMPDGSMIVVFPDGTRITTSYTVDEEPVFLEWSEEEMVAVATAIAKRQEEETKGEEVPQIPSQRPSTASIKEEKPRRESKQGQIRKSSLTKTPSEKHVQSPSDKKKSKGHKTDPHRRQSLTKHSRSSSLDGTQRRRSSVTELGDAPREPPVVIDPALFAYDVGFVSVQMNSCLEHPNYATVSYKGADGSAEIDMPYNMTVRVGADGLYSASIDEKTQLEVQEDFIDFSCLVCPSCSTLNRTTLDLSGFRPPKNSSEAETPKPSDVFCRTLDGWGHCHTITYSGVSSLVSLEQAQEDGDDDDSIQDNFQCLPPASRWLKRRCFVINRDWTGQEMLHDDDAKTYLTSAQDTPDSVVVTDNVPNKSGLRYHTVLSPILKTESQKWLMEYKSKYILPHSMRKKHLRSTYGDPPCWYHPFPKQVLQTTPPTPGGNGRGDAEAEEHVSRHDLTLRILQEMASRVQGDNVIAAIHEGLVKYWNAAATKFEEYSEHPALDPRTEEEIDIEDQLLRAAVGQASVSVPEMFRRRHKSLGPKFGAMERLQGRISAHAAYLEHVLQRKAEENEEKEAYKAILRNKTIPPYFKSVAGESFLKVLGAMDSAISEAEERAEGLEEEKEEVRRFAGELVGGMVENQIGEVEDVVSDVIESVKSVTMDEIEKKSDFESKRTQTR